MIQVFAFTFNAFAENTYVLADETNACLIIDPGCYEKVEAETLKNFILSKGLKPEKVINTHCHIDHVLGNAFIRSAFGIPLLIPEKEVEVLKSVPVYAPVWGFQQYQHTEPDGLIPNGGTVTFGASTLQVLYVPGHSPGHQAFYTPEERFCINGDVLFRESIGRTDLPGGNFKQLAQSIQQVLFKLPDDTLVYTGHGKTTTIGHEKQYNPFVR
jgi:glyoxylase-like metal-dependent hydrolase (beta-lactamase superfamily II)